MLLVSLRDSGPGIAAEAEANLYTPFFSTKEGGMGIGLNISRSIIEFHGGKLWHEPGTDCGTVFYLTLPVQST
jgi:two-component system sensor histidine kinase DctS